MKGKVFFIVVLTFVIAGLLIFNGCESSTLTGAGLGGAAGAGIGALAGRDTESTLIGAALGTAAGGAIGAAQDMKKERARTDAAIAEATTEANTFYVNVHNSNNSITPVKIIKKGNRYIDPKGIEYPQLPSEEQLKAAGYGF